MANYFDSFIAFYKFKFLSEVLILSKCWLLNDSNQMYFPSLPNTGYSLS